MRRPLAVLVLPVLLFVLASPTPPVLVANHETQQCATIPGGDECFDCQPTSDGWEVLGFSHNTDCPGDYEVVETDYACAAFTEQFCCTIGHSGVAGDCEPMVINDWKNQCAFVPDVENCAPPRGWKKRVDVQTDRVWGCPTNYEWTSVDCLSEEEARKQSPFGFCPCSGALLTGLLLAIAGVVSTKKTEIVSL